MPLWVSMDTLGIIGHIGAADKNMEIGSEAYWTEREFVLVSAQVYREVVKALFLSVYMQKNAYKRLSGFEMLA
jgi:hypothetical protein